MLITTGSRLHRFILSRLHRLVPANVRPRFPELINIDRHLYIAASPASVSAAFGIRAIGRMSPRLGPPAIGRPSRPRTGGHHG